MKYFDGKKIRDGILSDLKSKIDQMDPKPGLAVICIGDNPVCSKYVGLKQKVADKLGVNFFSYYFDTHNTQEEIITKIQTLNKDDNVDGIMVQIPIPDKFDKFEIVHAISPEKDVDGLRFCCSYKSNFRPPVVLAILRAIELSTVCHSEPRLVEGEESSEESDRSFTDVQDDKSVVQDDESVVNCLRDKEVVVVGRGFLVGWPLAQCLEETVPGLIVADNTTKNLSEITKTADILISAVGKHDIIKPEMIKEGVVLIDAGTTEVSGEMRGDIDPACYEKASLYTPVPGGIGPVTVAMLFTNLIGE